MRSGIINTVAELGGTNYDQPTRLKPFGRANQPDDKADIDFFQPDIKTRTCKANSASAVNLKPGEGLGKPRPAFFS